MSLEIKLLVDGVTMHLLEPVSGCTKGTSSKKKGCQSVDSRGGYPRVGDSSKYSAPILANSILDLDPVCRGNCFPGIHFGFPVEMVPHLNSRKPASSRATLTYVLSEAPGWW